MFSNILDCPACQHRFLFDIDEGFPEKITCPSCHKATAYQEYSMLVMCNKCQQKLRLRIEDLLNSNVACSLCNELIDVSLILNQNKHLNTSSELTEEESAASKRLLQDGEFFDKFKILHILGKGGMAEVYLAEHLLLKRKCAIKIMSASGSNDQIFVKRFIREAKLAHSIENPYIVSVFDAGCDFKTGHMFIAMDYVEGKNLIEISNGRKMSEKELLDILFNVATALKILNENKIVHRDIKPSNIMKDKDGIYKLMDLGIAKSNADRQAGEMTLTMDRQTIGTPSYASPEQCQSAHTADIRSDIYSLGATLYHLATGQIPYSGTTTVEIILKVIKHDLVPLKTLRPDLSRGMSNLIEAMMRSNPDERPQTPEALLKFATSRLEKEEDFKTRMIDFVKNIPVTVKDIPTKLVTLSTKAKELSSTNKKPQFPAKTKTSAANIVQKYLLTTALIITIIFLLLYIRYEQKNRKINAELATLQKTSESRTKKVKAPKSFSLTNLDQLMSYPDPDGLYSSQIASLVYFPDDNDCNPLQTFDFSKPEAVTHRVWKENCDNGALVIPSEIAPGTNLEKYSYNYGKYLQNYSIAVSLAPDTFDNRFLFSFCGINVCTDKSSVIILTEKNFIRYPIKPTKCLNICWSVDAKNRILTFFLQNRLAGRYLLPEQFAYTSYGSIISFEPDASSQLTRFSGKVYSIEIWESPRYYLLKNKSKHTAEKAAAKPETSPTQVSSPKLTQKKKDAQKKSASAKTAISAEKQTKKTTDTGTKAAIQKTKAAADIIPEKSSRRTEKRTIAWRLQACIERMQKVQAQKNYFLKDSTEEFIRNQIAELQKQDTISKEVLAAKKRNYNAAETQKFVSEFQNLKKNDNAEVKKAAFMLRKPKVDPNIYIKTGSGKKFILDAILNKGFTAFTGAPLWHAVISKRTDFNLADRNNPLIYLHLAHSFFQNGVEDVDSGKGLAPAFRMIKTSPYYLPYAQSVDDSAIIKFLYLAPKVNIHNSAGNTLMHVAARYNLIHLAKHLYYAGFTMYDKRNNVSLSPWDVALKHGSSDVADFLELIGESTKESANDKAQIELFKAIKENNMELFQKLVKSGKVDLHTPGYNNLSAIEYVCAEKRIAMLEIMAANKVVLTEMGNSQSTLNRNRKHPLVIAILNADLDTFNWLLKHGVSSNVNFITTANADNVPSLILQLVKFRKTTPANVSEELQPAYTHVIQYDKLHITENIAYEMIEAMIQYDKTFNINRIHSRSRGTKSLPEIIKECYPSATDRELREKMLKLAERYGAKSNKDENKTNSKKLRKKNRNR